MQNQKDNNNSNNTIKRNDEKLVNLRKQEEIAKNNESNNLTSIQQFPNYSQYAKEQENKKIQSNLTEKDKNSSNVIDDTQINIIANKVNSNTNQIKSVIESVIKEEFKQMREFIHEELKHIHVDMIRQFQLQEIKIINEIRSSVALNQELNKQLKNLKKTNDELKTNYF